MSVETISNLTDKMRAVEISQFGGPEVLVLGCRAFPRPRSGEVLIQVVAAGVNRPDIMQRSGLYPPPLGASDLPVLDVSGLICEIGDCVSSEMLGQEVCALVGGGGYAEDCVANVGHCLSTPSGLDMIESAALPERVFTVWTNVFDRGQLKPGESVLVHGGSSGIGTTAIQLASAFGARVFATAGTADKCAACKRLGAEQAINYRDEDFVEVINTVTSGSGVDVVLDMVGGDYTPRNIRVLAPSGRLVQIAILGGPKTTINWIPIMQKRLVLTGSTLRPRPNAEKAAIAQALHQTVWPLIEQGQAQPVIYATFALKEASEAHQLMAVSYTHLRAHETLR